MERATLIVCYGVEGREYVITNDVDKNTSEDRLIDFLREANESGSIPGLTEHIPDEWIAECRVHRSVRGETSVLMFVPKVGFGEA